MAGILRKKFLVLGLVTAAGLVLLVACGTMNSSADKAAGPNASFNPAAGGTGNNNNGSGFEIASSTGGTPPEQKVTLAVEVPQASQNYVYAANPDRDSVAVINPVNLSIQTVAVDSAPHGLRTVSNQDSAIVVNTGASTVSVLHTDGSGTQSVTLPVMIGANVVSVAPDGKHALVYFDASMPTAGPPSESPKRMTALDLTKAPPIAYSVTVGYHPSSVTYSTDSTNAYVVSDDGVSDLVFGQLATPAQRTAVPVPLYDATDTATANIFVTPDGAYAIAHQPGSPDLRLVDLAVKDRVDLSLSDFFSSPNSDAGLASIDVSDVEVAPDGSFLLAVVRDQKTLLRVPIPLGFEDKSQVQRIDLPNVITGVANVGPNGHYALLYTTVPSLNEQRVSILDLTGKMPIQVINLHKTINAVAFDPTGSKAYVLHNRIAPNPSIPDVTQDAITAHSYGYSVVDLASATSTLQLTPSQPGSLAALPDGTAMFLLFPDVYPYQVQRIDLIGFSVDPVEIGSKPTGIGFVKMAKQVFVSQVHPEGRMTFIDWTSLHVKSVTGYELNSSIWE